MSISSSVRLDCIKIESQDNPTAAPIPANDLFPFFLISITIALLLQF